MLFPVIFNAHQNKKLDLLSYGPELSLRYFCDLGLQFISNAKSD